jgi:hypothetical protein
VSSFDDIGKINCIIHVSSMFLVNRFFGLGQELAESFLDNESLAGIFVFWAESGWMSGDCRDVFGVSFL